MAKPIEFTAANPLVVLITRALSGDWVIQPHPSVKAKMIYRRDNDLIPAGIAAEYTARRNPTAPAIPHFLRDLDHIPIVFREGEVIRFVCDPPHTYTASMDPDPDVSTIVPGSPFGWPGPKMRTPGIHIDAPVLGPNGSGIGPKDQRFFLASSWVIDTAIVRADPDGICDR